MQVSMNNFHSQFLPLLSWDWFHLFIQLHLKVMRPWPWLV